jgi:hypothetical protein
VALLSFPQRQTDCEQVNCEGDGRPESLEAGLGDYEYIEGQKKVDMVEAARGGSCELDH